MDLNKKRLSRFLYVSYIWKLKLIRFAFKHHLIFKILFSNLINYIYNEILLYGIFIYKKFKL